MIFSTHLWSIRLCEHHSPTRVLSLVAPGLSMTPLGGRAVLPVPDCGGQIFRRWRRPAPLTEALPAR